MHQSPSLNSLETSYRQLIINLFERLQLKGISAAGKALSLPLEKIYVELKAVSDVPEAADTFSADERRLLQEAEAHGQRSDVDVRMNLDSLRFERWRSEARSGKTRSQRRSIEGWLSDPGSPGLVILGDPGSGKSTLLHYLALRVAREGLGESSGPSLDAAAASMSATRGARLPVFVPLAAYDDWLRRNRKELPLVDFLPIYYEAWHGLTEVAPLFHRALENGRALVLLDGLDEVLDVATRQHVANEARQLIQHEGGRGNRFVVTSRVVGYREAPLPGDLPHVTVLDFGPEEVGTFVKKWSEECEAWVAGGRTDVALRRAAIQQRALLDDVHANPSVLRLAANPLLLTMLALLRRQGGRLPEQRVRLYEKYVGMLLDNWESVRSENARTAEPVRFDQDLAMDYLIDLSLWLQRHKPSGTARRQEIEQALVEISLGLEGLDPKLAVRERAEHLTRAENFLRDVSHFAGLLVERGRDAFGFSHLTFQEYFAGRALARMDPEERWTVLEPNLHRPRWREPILLCAGQLGIIERRGKEVSELARRILGASSLHEPLLHRDVFLVAAMAADNVGIERMLLDDLTGRLRELTASRVVVVRHNALAGLGKLAQLGHEGAVDVLRDRIRSRAQPYEIENALRSVLAADSCAGLRQCVLDWLNDTDGEVRAVAIRSLKSVAANSEEARTTLLTALNAETASEREAAIDALTPLVPIDAEVRRLILAKFEDDSSVVGSAARALKDEIACDADVRSKVLSKLGSQNTQSVAAVVAAMGSLATTDDEIKAHLLNALSHDADTVRHAAVEALAALVSRDERVRQLIALRLDDPTSYVRQAATSALGSLATAEPSVRLLVLNQLEDIEANVREAAFSALQPLVSTNEEVQGIFLDRLNSMSWPVRHHMIRALKPLILRDEETRNIILGKSDDPHEDVRAAVVEALGTLAVGNTEILSLIASKLNDPNESVRVESIRALEPLLPTNTIQGLLVSKLDDPDEFVRETAIDALTHCIQSDSRLQGLVLNQVDESSPFASRAALSALATVADANPEARSAIMRAASQSKHGHILRSYAIEALGRIASDSEDAQQLILELTRDRDEWIRHAAVAELGRFIQSNERARRVAVERVDDSHIWVRAAALHDLGSLVSSSEKIRQIVLSRLDDPDDAVCSAAIVALQALVLTSVEVRRRVIDKSDDPSWRVRYAVLHATKPLVSNDENVRLLAFRKLDDPIFMVRLTAVRSLISFVSVDLRIRERLFPWLGVVSENAFPGIDADDVRRELADAYAPLLAREPRLLHQVLAMLRSSAWPERQAAAWSLITMPGGPPPEHLPVLRSLIDDLRAEESWLERLRVAASLVNDRNAHISKLAVDLSMQSLEYATAPWYGVEHSASMVRELAARALGRLDPVYRDSAVVYRLIRLMQEESDSWVLATAYRALLRLAEAPDPVLQPNVGIGLKAAPLQPVLVESLTIRDFKNIDELTLGFIDESALEGQWTCIAGVNGAGKSAVLQALALVLLGDKLATDVGSEWLKRMRRRDSERVGDARIVATIRQGDIISNIAVVIGENGIDKHETAQLDGDAMRAFWSERAKHHLLVGYGAGRNLSEAPAIEDDRQNPDVRRLMTLFDPLCRLASTEVLLNQRNEHGPVLTLLRRLLAVVLEGTGISVAADSSTLRFSVDSTAVPATDLPDGFRATIAWLADLCAAWYEKAPEEALTGEPGRIRGVVLIDEIDLHLHPKLQRLLVPRLRKALPEVQWIVTTHSPLVLSSFDRREIVALDLGRPGKRRVLDRQVLGFSTDEVYSWLMDTEPRSAALDEKFANGEHGIGADAALILAQSPEVNEEDAEENRAWRQKLASRMREELPERRNTHDPEDR
ncbi:sister chromatid cohesion protein PDS5 [Sorangium sp. So ce291]|uniref:sister chromatid cohesion protein PDS5 n=1 Tax=Sorangium sp. So ce291 TaxID=3133294 RepID=UPI003F62FC4D